MSATPFGLYRAASMTAAHRVATGVRFELDTPVTTGGATTFRTALWLPVPEAVQQAEVLRMAGAFAWRFEPMFTVVHTGDRAWFSRVQAVDDDTVRLTMTWPATLVRIGRQNGSKSHARRLELRRVDGEAVADAAAATGSSGFDLAEAWLGSPFEVRLGERDFRIAVKGGIESAIGMSEAGIGIQAAARAIAPAGSATVSPVGAGTGSAAAAIAAEHRSDSPVVPTVTIAGRPTGPRLSLVAEQPQGETLLWQELRPGEQAEAVTLPAAPLAEAWGPALAQLQRLCADPATRPLRLRLDLVSDAPCAVVAAALTPSIEVERELLAGPQRLDFSGAQAETWPLAFDPALGLAGVAPADVRGLTLHARWVGDGGAAVGGGGVPAPPEPRRGAWAEPGRTLWQPLDLSAPQRCEGAAWHGQALSAPLRLRLRLLADGGNGPATRVFAEQTVSIDAASAPGWQAARWPAIDLQPQRVWLALGLDEGAALWAFGAGGAAATAGLIDADGARQPLPEALAVQLLASPSAAASAGSAVQIRLGDTALAWRDAQADTPAQDDAALRLRLDAAQAAALRSQPLRFSAGTAGSLHIESVRLTWRA